MKAFIFFFFLSLSTYAQNFMNHMDVYEVMEDTMNVYPHTTVIWGMKQDTIGFLWDNHYPIYFIKRAYKPVAKSTRKLMAEYIEMLNEEQSKNKDYDKNKAVLRNIYFNQWDELYLI